MSSTATGKVAGLGNNIINLPVKGVFYQGPNAFTNNGAFKYITLAQICLVIQNVPVRKNCSHAVVRKQLVTGRDDVFSV